MSNKVKPYTWLVRMDVAPMWVADGGTISDADAIEMLATRFPSACMSGELAARVIAAPNRERMLREMGYQVEQSNYQSERERMARDVLIFNNNKFNLLHLVATACNEIGQGQSDQAIRTLHKVLMLASGESPISDIEWREADE